MSKWKCGICGSEFDNFQAQGFEGIIYCPLCYYKKLYKDTELERERLNNIINEFENYIRARADHNDTCSVCSVMTDDLLNILKGSDKE